MSASAPSQTVFSIGYDFHYGAGNNGNVWGITNYKDNSRNQSFTWKTASLARVDMHTPMTLMAIES